MLLRSPWWPELTPDPPFPRLFHFIFPLESSNLGEHQEGLCLRRAGIAERGLLEQSCSREEQNGADRTISGTRGHHLPSAGLKHPGVCVMSGLGRS